MMAVVDADSGKVSTTLPIGDHVDATVFDPATARACLRLTAMER